MRARAAAAEIASGDEDTGATIARPVQHEIGILLPVRPVAPAGEQLLARTRHLATHHRLGRDDGVGVDVLAHERGRQPMQDGEFPHDSYPLIGRTSVIRPVTAPAATMAGLATWVRLCGPCRASKLRLVVEMLRGPGGTTLPFAAAPIRQPG